MENLHQDIIQSLTEYDLESIVAALCELHGADAVREAIPSHCAWQVASERALVDELIQVCKGSN